MRGHRWHGVPLIVPARTLAGSVTQVTLGVVDTTDGLVRAIQIAEGVLALLPRQATTELVSHAETILSRELPGDRR